MSDGHGEDLVQLICEIDESICWQDPGFAQDLEPVNALIGFLFDDGQFAMTSARDLPRHAAR